MHFSMFRKEPDTTYVIFVKNLERRKMVIPEKGEGFNRDGASPPSEGFLKQYCPELPTPQARRREGRGKGKGNNSLNNAQGNQIRKSETETDYQ